MNVNPCLIPRKKIDEVGDNRWESMHKRYVAESKLYEPEVVLIGDSIIQQLQLSSIWNEKFSSLHCLNFGIGGDKVEHVLWRIQNGELDFSTNVKVVVLMVGTNNTKSSAQDVFEGILELIKTIKTKLGNTKLLLLTLLPRGQHPNPNRERNTKVNALIMEKFSNDSSEEICTNVFVVPIHEHIIQSDKTISHHILHDYLHLTNYGYTKTFGLVYEKLCEIIQK